MRGPWICISNHLYLNLPTEKAVLDHPCCGEANPASWKLRGTWRVEPTSQHQP